MVLAEMIRFLSEHGICHALAGAVALHAFGWSRTTNDLDLIVEEPGRDALLAHLQSLGYELLHSSEGFSNHIHSQRRWGRLDFIYLDAPTAEIIFTEAHVLQVFANIAMPVPRPEHLIAMKKWAMKTDPLRTLRDLVDIDMIEQLANIPRSAIEPHRTPPQEGPWPADMIVVRATAEDVVALQRAARLSRSVPPEEYAFFLGQFQLPLASVRARNGPRGERFTL
jgi:hypothetical protein